MGPISQEQVKLVSIAGVIDTRWCQLRRFGVRKLLEQQGYLCENIGHGWNVTVGLHPSRGCKTFRLHTCPEDQELIIL